MINISEFICSKGNIHSSHEFVKGVCPCGGHLVSEDGLTRHELIMMDMIDEDEREEEDMDGVTQVG